MHWGIVVTHHGYIRQNISLRKGYKYVHTVASEIHESCCLPQVTSKIVNSGGFLDLAIRKSKRQNEVEKWLAMKMHGILPSCFLLI